MSSSESLRMSIGTFLFRLPLYWVKSAIVLRNSALRYQDAMSVALSQASLILVLLTWVIQLGRLGKYPKHCTLSSSHFLHGPEPDAEPGQPYHVHW